MATNPTVSPISQILSNLGMTREELTKRTDSMRQFLHADDDVPKRVAERDKRFRERSGSDLRNYTRSTASTSSLSRSLSRASSTSMRDATPPATTPVKSEPHEASAPLRTMDSMEMVIARQRRQRRERRERERESKPQPGHPPSPLPSLSNASLSSRPRDHSRTASSTSAGNADNTANSDHEGTLPPITPQRSRYYREHTMHISGSLSESKTETATPTATAATPAPAAGQNNSLPQFYSYAGLMPYAYLAVPYRAPFLPASMSVPITPQAQRIAPSSNSITRSSPPPPSSSPPLASSPISSPTRVNLVSSPGPLGPAPDEDQYERLPYTLPPGPYSDIKPDLSYAALVGRAILSSPDHRLTLQEIYDWITIVFPYYKRGETTWMNSIRHVLSTTVVFRKVPRERAVGRTLWAIYDEDLECFKDGGFKKHLCKDYQNGNDGKGGKGKGRARKREDDDGSVDTRKAKRARNHQSSSSGSLPTFAGPSLSTHPLFPPTRPTPQHQPYYESLLPSQHQPLPADLIFPPLPAASAYLQAQAVKEAKSEGDITPPSSQQTSSSTSSSGASIPELTPTRDSSSPSSSLPPSSDVDLSTHEHDDSSDARDSNTEEEDDDEEEPLMLNHEDIFNTALLGSVKSWSTSPQSTAELEPGIELMDFGADLEDKKGKRPARTNVIFPPIPVSPSLNCRSTKASSSDRSSTPPPSMVIPSTPPRKASQHHLSSIRTPISHKGVTMSPSASLAHYKSNLDPPPIYSKSIAPLELLGLEDDEDSGLTRTPRKRVGSNPGPMLGPPVTPKRLLFSAALGDSPFRTPGGLGVSPFRTPGSRNLLDPHDPKALLDDEMNRSFDSPAGLFGKDRSRLLYDSPGIDSSPDKYHAWGW